MAGRLAWLMAGMALAYGSIFSAEGGEVFRAGKVLMPIYVGRQAGLEDRATAAELSRVLGRMCGVTWPVATEGDPTAPGIYLGNTDAAAGQLPPPKVAEDILECGPGEMSPDGFCLTAAGNRAFVRGATPEATYFGVCWLLEEYGGVRWFAPGDLGEVIPSRSEWNLPDLDVMREPAYVSREIYGLDGEAGLIWARHNRLRGRFQYSHALGRVVGRDAYEAHPDWRPLIGGERVDIHAGETGRFQPDLTNPGVSDYAAAKARAAFERGMDSCSFSLGIDDTMRFDQGAETRKRVEPLRYFRGRPDYSPLVFAFMNQTAEKLGDSARGRYLGCLAYFWCENTPPFPVNGRVVPYLTADRSQYYDEKFRKEDFELMARWSRSGVKAFGLWEYAYGGGFLVPRQACKSWFAAIREASRLGAKGYIAEICPEAGYDEFKTWALARLLWRPDLTDEALENEFFSGYFGPAAVPARKFFEACEAQWMNQTGESYWLKYYNQEDQSLLFPENCCLLLGGLLEEASARAKGNPAVEARVARLRGAFALTCTYLEFDRARRELTGMDDENLPAGVEVARLIAAYAQKRDRFEKRVAADGRTDFVRACACYLENDPVPRILWLAERNCPGAAARILETAKVEDRAWLALAKALEGPVLGQARNLAENGSFAHASETYQQPRFLFPGFERLPSGWLVHAMATEKGALTVRPAGEGAGELSLRGAWDTQVFQWRPVVPGKLCVARVHMRGRCSAGSDAGLFMSFLSRSGKPVGEHRIQQLPKGGMEAGRTLVLAEVAPGDAAWIGVGVVAARQTGEDHLEASDVSLQLVDSGGAR